MRKLLKVLFVVLTLFVSSTRVSAQGFSFNCTRDTTINICNTTQCLTLQATIPDIHALTSSYTLNPTSSIPGCFPVYVNPGDPGTSANLTVDDKYSSPISIGFTFPFYGTNYTQLVASTNGYVSFNTSLAGNTSHYGILNNGGGLSATSGVPQDLPSALYDAALIMGPYHDLDPAVTTSPNRKVQYSVVGAAPHRRWVLSFYKQPLFSSACNPLIENTHQIILYESTGIIEVTIFSKEICTGWNQGRAMIGIQNNARNQGMVVPGRAASSTPWGGLNMNESYRFVPSAGASLFKRVELYDLAGTLIATGTAAPSGNGQLLASFPSICPPSGTTSYIVRSVYTKIDDPAAEVFGSDTVRVTRSNETELNATTSATASVCGPNGSITVNVPSGVGVPPFAYSLNGGAPVSSTSPTHTFTGLVAGTYTVTVTDAAGCSSTKSVTVTSSGTLTVTPTVTAPPCNGSINGTITLTPQNGMGPYQYSLNNSTWQSSNVFTNLPPGSYFTFVRDNSGCVLNNFQVTIPNGPPITATASSVPPACPGASNGTITVTPTSGTAPYTYRLNTGSFGSSNVFTNLPSGNYFVSVRDALGCFVNNISVTIGAGTGNLNVTATPSGTSCTGATNGSITLTPTNGSGPYQYALNGGAYQAGTVIPNLAAGTYSITVKDNSGCTSAPLSVTVSQGSALLATASSTPTACSGMNNGTITVTPTNGSGPYQFSLNGGAPQSSNIFTSVAPGSHNVVVTDGAGCVSAAIPVTVATGPELTATATPAATSCTGAVNGSISVTPNNGVAPYEYAINGGAFQASGNFTGLAAGSHVVVVRDAAGCVSAAIPVTIAAGPALTGTVTTASTSCNGAANGSITATPGNGASPYTYSIDGGAFQASNIFNNLAAGTYAIVIRDAAGCATAPIPATVTVGPALTGTATASATSCNGATNGSITATPGNGATPHQFALNGGAFQASNTFTGLAAGSYTVVIRDAAGCESAPVSVTVAAGAALTGTAAATPTSCSGATNGTITATASNGNGPFEYALDGGAFQPGATFNGVAAGSHTVVIRDGAGCTSAPIPVTVSVGPALLMAAATTPTSCSGANNGTITVTPSNGSAPYTYSIDGSTFQGSNTFTGLATGSYNIVIRDAAGCTSSPLPVTVNTGLPLTATVATTNVLCNGGSTGTATITIGANSAPPYSYSLDGTTYQPSNQFTGLAAGSYTVYFRDNNSCAGSTSFSIAAPAPLTVSATAEAAKCNGAADGRVTATPAGGTAPYQYSLDGTAWQSGPGFTVAAGTHTVYVRDAAGCVQQATATVTEPAVLTATATTADATCDVNGQVSLTPTGGTAPYYYSIGASAPYEAYNVFNVAAGSYSTSVQDANGCVFNVPAVTVALTNNLVVTPAADPAPICEGEKVQLNPQTNASQFSWAPATGLSAVNVKNPEARPSVTTEYVVTATLGSCTLEDRILVSVNPAPIADAGPNGDICFGQTYQLQGSGGTGFEWSPTTGIAIGQNSSQPVVEPEKTTEYSLHVTDANGCRSLQPDVVVVQVTPPIVVNISSDTSAAIGDQFQLHASSAATSYEWSPATGLDDPYSKDPLVTIAGDVTYKVTVSTSAGCKGEAFVTIKVYNGPEIYVPNAFTPNGDGRNEIFRPFPVGIKKLNYFRVFNRWGQIVYSTTDFNKGWDGRIGGVMQPPGTYVWMAEGITKEDKVITKKGTVTLIQ